MNVQELAEGLWRWTAPHPDWTPEARWPRDVGCLYHEGEAAIALVDPLVPAEARDEFLEALDRDVERAGLPVHVLRTVGWHERSCAELVARYGGRTGVPPGVEPVELDGIEFPEGRETVFWIPAHRALVVGDSLLGDGGGVRVCPPDWVSPGAQYPRPFVDSLRRLLDLPVEQLLVSHGEPVLSGGGRALEDALAGV